MYQREIKDQILEKMFKGKVILIYGARQVGKTTLVKEILKDFPDHKYISCEEFDVQEALVPHSHEYLKKYIGDHKVVVFDEAQTIENIGLVLKILVDFYPEIQLIATGSSSFDLANKVGEPLVGRSWTFNLYPLSLLELKNTKELPPINSIFDLYLVYGSYPGVVGIDFEEKKDQLEEIVNKYLYKDLLSYNGIKNPLVLKKLTKLLAYQMGNEVSYTEIADTLKVSRKTVESYIDLLEQSFIIFRLHPFFNKKRNEIKKKPKIFFWDNGIRNALIDKFDSIELRTDKGALFENLFISEKLKME